MKYNGKGRILLELQNDKSETVVIVTENKNHTVTAWFGLEPIINDMEFFTSIGHEIIYDITQIILKTEYEISEEDEL